MARKKNQLYPDFTAFIDEIEQNGITPLLISKIIERHRPNSRYNEALFNRYNTMDGSLPIFKRKPRFDENKPINNKINNDFFSEIVDFKTGYFAGKPISYSYSTTDEAEEVTGGVEAIDKATKALTDFVTRNNMYGVDMETTKYASIYGYAGRLFYIDPEGEERVMPVHGFETIILSKTDITEPQYAIRYFKTYDINNVESWTVEFYDNENIYTYKGNLTQLERMGEVQPHLFDYCPLQGIANNKEMLGDAEKVLSLIDDYDKTLSDNSNEVEAFAHAYLIFEGLRIDDKTIEKGQASGSFVFPATGTQQGKAYYLTKNINDAFTEHHLQRLEENIYRFSRTPNLSDETFGAASGVSLKFKLHGLETKCGMYEAKMLDAAQFMFKLLASAWIKKAIAFDPLQVSLEFKRNFPLDKLSEAQTAQAFITAGLPKEWVFSQISGIDDVDYIMEMLEQEKDVTSLYENGEDDENLDVGVNDKNMYKVTSVLGQLKRGQITRTVAIRILTGLGFTDENAETLVEENIEENEQKKKKEKEAENVADILP